MEFFVCLKNQKNFTYIIRFKNTDSSTFVGTIWPIFKTSYSYNSSFWQGAQSKIINIKYGMKIVLHYLLVSTVDLIQSIVNF